VGFDGRREVLCNDLRGQLAPAVASHAVHHQKQPHFRLQSIGILILRSLPANIAENSPAKG
jgi:hypothetical protein